jgi:hypothetical protein
MIISTNFPGGNAIVKELGPNEYEIDADQRIGTMEWFYWCFKLTNLENQEYIFRFPKNRMSQKGYAISVDNGLNWVWADPKTIQDTTIKYKGNASTKEVILSMGMTYTLKNWEHFLALKNEYNCFLQETLCLTRGKRITPLLRIKSKNPTTSKIIITARHHCCEMMASYMVEGLVDFAFRNNNQLAFENTEFVVIPFVDLDGVEAGDQGKGRAPYDHNRDYGEKSIYPEIPAIKNEVSKNKSIKTITIDLHCPHLKGTWNEQVYIVGSGFEKNCQAQKDFLSIIEKENKGPLPFSQKNILPFGVEWNTNQLVLSCTSWCTTQAQVILAASIELPYGIAEGQEVNQTTARKLGEILCLSLVKFVNKH